MKRFTQYLLWIFITTLWATICFIVPDFFDAPITDIASFCKYFLYVIILSISIFLFLYAIGVNKYIASIFLPIFAIIGSAVAYFRVAQHATVTPMIVEVTLQTNLREAQSVISWHLYAYVVFNICIVVGLLYWRFRILHPHHLGLHLFIVIGLFSIFYNCNNQLQIAINNRYPYNVFFSLYKYGELQYLRKHQIKHIPQTILLSSIDTLNVIFVLGESVRADHIGLNGYKRNTTPRLAQRDNIVSLPNIYTVHTHTAGSVPQILTKSDDDQYKTSTSFISCFRQNHFFTSWISNQDYGESYKSYIQEADTTIFPHADKNCYIYTDWFDTDLLHPTLSIASAKHLSILHTIGSHWYYNNHIPEEYEYYHPITHTRVVAKNTREEIINEYDNSIRYLDYFLDTLISTIEDRPAIMIYLSDHGESLGEEGRYLHANDGPECKNPACLIWYSDKYEAMFPAKIDALKANYNNPYTIDFVFYSILSAAGIAPVENVPQLDIFTHSQTH